MISAHHMLFGWAEQEGFIDEDPPRRRANVDRPPVADVEPALRATSPYERDAWLLMSGLGLHTRPRSTSFEPEQLQPAKDPDEFVHVSGPSVRRELLASRRCGIAWRARELTAVTRDSPIAERRAALPRAERWLGGLPQGLALEQEDAIRLIADQCGYIATELERAFQARSFGK